MIQDMIVCNKIQGFQKVIGGRSMHPNDGFVEVISDF